MFFRTLVLPLAGLSIACSPQHETARERPLSNRVGREDSLAGSAIATARDQAETPDESSPVMVGGNGDLDVCATLAVVGPLNPGGDGYLAIRSRPSTDGAERARLKPHHPLAICSVSKDGQWYGVVYALDDGGQALTSLCGVLAPIEGPPYAYDGPCQAGWVSRRFVEMSAG